MTKITEITRGDDLIIPVIPNGAFGDLTGASAYVFLVPKTATVSDVTLDPAAVLTSSLGPFASNVTEMDFVLTSQSSVPNSTLIPVAQYGWYGRVVSAAGKRQTFRFDSVYVDVIAPKGNYA